MAHGAGGKASRALVEGVFVPLLANPALDAARRRGAARRSAAPGWRCTTDAFVVTADPVPRRLDRRAGRQRHGQRPRGVRRAAAGPVRRPRPRGGVRRPTSSGPRSTAMAEAARAAGVPVVTGDTKVVERGKCDSMYVVTTGVGVLDEHDVPLGAAAGPARATRCSCPARSATTASRSCWPGATSTSRPTSAATPGRCGRWRRRCSTPCGDGPALHARRDPRRRRDGAQRDRAGRRGRRRARRGAGCRCVPRSVGAGEILGIDPLYVANEGKLRRLRRGRPGRRGAGRGCARCRPARMPRCVGEVRDEPPGRVLGRTGVRRPPDDRHAGRRPAAADLLTAGEEVPTVDQEPVAPDRVAGERQRPAAPPRNARRAR